MAKDLYEEAIADVKRLTQVAEDNAKRDIIEACIPRIREFIENELMGNDLGDEDDAEQDVDVDSVVMDANPVVQPADGSSSVAPTTPGLPEPQGDLLADSEDAQAAAVSLPDEEGKVTLDIDAVATPAVEGPTNGEGYYEVSLESLEALAPIAEAAKKTVLGRNISSIVEATLKFKAASPLLRVTDTFQNEIANVLSRVENIYGYVQENVKDPAEKSVHENRLEAIYRELNELQEQKMKKQQKQKLNEEDVTLTLTGLPDDIDLDGIGVDLVSGDDEGDQGQGDDQGLDADAQGADDQGAQVDFDALGGDEDQDVEEGDQMIEIDENMLRQEIKRMRALRENEHKQGKADDANVLDDFGGGKDDGDPWEDHDVRTAPHGHMNEAEEVEESAITEEDETVDEAEEVQESKKVSKGKNAPSKAAVKSEAARRSPGTKTEEALRAKLAETNLFNAKLMYTNKLLQSEALNKRQKATVIERLDEAKSVREVKLVYESLVKMIAGKTRQVSEGTERRVLGSSSRATKPSSSPITEGFETDRWARLAGLKD